MAILREISAELGKIGSNINQIAHHLNAGGSVYSVYYDLQEVIKDVKAHHYLDHMIYYLEHVEDWQIRETNKTISFRMPHMKKSIRGKSLGESYDKAALEKRIAEALTVKEEMIKAEQETMREEKHEVAEEQSLVKMPIEEFVCDMNINQSTAELFKSMQSWLEVQKVS